MPDFAKVKIDHRIKSWPQFFQPMIEGIKKHDMRNLRDRAYNVGQVLLLQEFDPFGGGYTGREAAFRITYVTSNTTPCALSSAALANDFAILSLELLSVCPGNAMPETAQPTFDFAVAVDNTLLESFLMNCTRVHTDVLRNGHTAH